MSIFSARAVGSEASTARTASHTAFATLNKVEERSVRLHETAGRLQLPNNQDTTWKAQAALAISPSQRQALYHGTAHDFQVRTNPPVASLVDFAAPFERTCLTCKVLVCFRAQPQGTFHIVSSSFPELSSRFMRYGKFFGGTKKEHQALTVYKYPSILAFNHGSLLLLLFFFILDFLGVLVEPLQLSCQVRRSRCRGGCPLSRVCVRRTNPL